MCKVENLGEIKAQFDDVIRYSQDIPEPQTSYLFAEWIGKKAKFIEKFGSLIYEFPEKVKFELEESEKEKRIDDFLYEIAIKYNTKPQPLIDFVAEQRDGFFTNLTISDYEAPDGKIIRKGTKLVKAFKHFVKGDKALFELQNRASMIIQENKIEGRLCLSVHPLDYLSISENNHNWRSCHSLDGDYRAGNLSYMLDESTIICYLKSDEDQKLPNFPENVKWNSKKWRVLLYFSQDWNMIFAGKQYPFKLTSIMDYVLKEALPQANLISNYKEHPFFPYSWSGWTNSYVDNFEVKYPNLDEEGFIIRLNPRFYPIEDGLIGLKDLVKDAKGSKHYNDVIYSSNYTPIYCCKVAESCREPFAKSMVTYKDTTKFEIGGMTKCLRCGQEEIMLGSGNMYCTQCELEYGNTDNEDFTFCSCCDAHILIDDACYMEGEWLCQHCFNSMCSYCENCQEYRYNEDIYYIEEKDKYVCTECYGS